MTNDDRLLSEAYSQIYQEGIGDRLKGQAAGLGAYAKQGLKNIGASIARGVGNEVEPSNKTATNAFADAQQNSLIKTFIKKAQKEVDDFKKDMAAMGGDEEAIKNDPNFSSAAQQIQQVTNLINYLNGFGSGGETPNASEGQGENKPEAGQTPTPSSSPEQKTNTEAESENDENYKPSEEDAAKINAGISKPQTLAVKTTTPTQTQGGLISHGRQNVPNGTVNYSASMANSQPKPERSIGGNIDNEPVQKAYNPGQRSFDAEIVPPTPKPTNNPPLRLNKPQSQIENTFELNGVKYMKYGTGWKNLSTGRVVKKEEQPAIEKAFLDQRNKQAGVQNSSTQYPPLLEHWYNIITDLQ
jgi:hypothetical protein